MPMKASSRIFIALIVAATLCVGASAVRAASPTVRVYQDLGQYSSGSGGEFNVAITAGPLSHANSARTEGSRSPGFQTFCIQKSQYFIPGNQYTAKVSEYTNHTTHDLLKAEVAYLFHWWNTGTMSGYDYTYGAGRTQSAGHLQNVLWALQYGGSVAAGTEYDWWKKAKDDVANGLWSGRGAVRVLQLTGDPTWPGTVNGDYQDQLIETPEPASLALLAIGALPVLPVIRRRRSA